MGASRGLAATSAPDRIVPPQVPVGQKRYRVGEASRRRAEGVPGADHQVARQLEVTGE